MERIGKIERERERERKKLGGLFCICNEVEHSNMYAVQKNANKIEGNFS